MSSSAQHARHRRSASAFRVPRVLLRAGLAVSAVGAALAGGVAQAASAAADEPPGLALDVPVNGKKAVNAKIPRPNLDAALQHVPSAVLSPVTNLRLDPLAKTGVDPLDNAVGTQIADFKPVSTKPLTAPISQGGSLRDLPLVGQVVKLLPTNPR
ncbi:hypothetical protein RKE29_29900 [Streptomyces sp. B1866]|uniref:hypothetical protein n=1 Tax=Streptomyces sp. B1866 TaxID=3075431 RepID=UPI0028917687|nr:hypothetical protein [Streptomyces sp. B1866]MDT3400764.1 hypothetical protein [Streptomyces sp. B1866]